MSCAHKTLSAAALLLPADVVHGHFQSALDPHAPHAGEIAEISRIMFIGATVIFVLVMAATAYSVFSPERARRLLGGYRSIVVGGLVLPIILLSALLVYTLKVAGEIVRPSEPAAVRVEVIGEQFWWRVRYLDPAGTPLFETANEIHLPAGRPTEFTLRTADVIHSFWVPNLAGKIDMIPGHVSRLRVRPERPGEFRGQCAEYCGAQHAKMAFLVVVDTPDDFAAWLAAQRLPAVSP